MYSKNSIEVLSKRIGFGTAKNVPEFDFDYDIVFGNAKRTFDYFHKLVYLDSIYLSVAKQDMDQEEFEVELEKLRMNSAISTLSRVLMQNPEYIDEKNYDEIITAKTAILEEVYGYTLAIDVLELFITSPRSNLATINANLSYEKLKLDLYGFKNEQGVEVAAGLVSKLETAIKKATNAIFPVNVKIKDGKVW